MIRAPKHPDERARLAALRASGLLDSPPEQAFDDAVTVASAIAGTPIALVSLVDDDRQWFKAKVGLDATQTGRDEAFCAHAILREGLFEIRDARADERFHDNPLVTGAPHVTFYAGMPLKDPASGLPLGTICVIDRVPRDLTDTQREALRAAARQVEQVLLARLQAHDVVQALTRSEAAQHRLEEAQRLGRVGDWVYDPDEARFDGSLEARRLCGYGPEDPVDLVELLGRLAPSVRKPFVRALVDVHAGHCVEEVLDLELTRPTDGQTVILRTHIRQRRDREGRVAGVGGDVRDVTDEVTTRAALREARDEARESAAAKAEFLAVMSHEIRTPLNGVLGLAELLEQTELSAVQQDYIHRLRQSGDALLSLVNNILDFSKLEAGKVQLESIPFDPVVVVEQVGSTFASKAAVRGLALATRPSPSLPGQVMGDPSRLRQIVLNLVGNAIKFTERGSVVVEVHHDGTDLLLAVVDTGIGIPADKRHGLFAAFSQADRSTTRKYGGTGLGLAISARLAVAMGGSLSVDSEEGVGSTFTLRVPAAAVAKRDRPLQGRLVALAIEDAVHRRALSERLTLLGATTLPWNRPGRRPELASHALVDQRALEGPWGEAAARGDEAGIAMLLVHPLSDGARPPPRWNGRSLAHPVSSEELLRRWTSGEAEPEVAEARFTGRVLVAEDNAINRLVAGRIFEGLGVAVDLVEDGQLAVDAITAGQVYDLIVLDGHMPHLDGIGAAQAIRAHLGDATPPLVALTASALPGDREMFLSGGFDDYLTKPTTVPALRGLLATWLGRPERSVAC